MSALKKYTMEEVARHNKDGDSWIVIDGKVYDVSKFTKMHPGGRHVLATHAGKEVSEQFHVYHGDHVMKKHGPRLIIGELETQPEERPVHLPGSFGDMIPYGDPMWYQRFNSPYYKETHRVWREKVRRFVENEVMPEMDKWRNDDKPPKEILLKMGQEGFLAVCTGPPWPTQYLPSHIHPPADYDYFHEMILYDEFARCGSSSVVAALTNGCAIGLPVILRFGTEEMKQAIVPDVLLGKKQMALAISEPQAGSDVAGMVTVGRKEGDHYVINGNKKWITNGTYADYFVTAVRTGKPGQLTFFLVERDTDGFEVKKVRIRDSNISGTAYMDFDECKVPVKNVIGTENKGFKLVMFNFNHERLYVVAVMCRLSRVCLEESLRYAVRRRAFGKTLSDVQAIRMKIAAMARSVEQLQCWLDYLTYQMCTMTHEEANLKIGDVVCLLKAQGSKVYEYCAREATMVFGGNSMMVGGVGKKIEAAVGQVKGYQIPAGSEDVMDDYASRAAFKMALKMAKL